MGNKCGCCGARVAPTRVMRLVNAAYPSDGGSQPLRNKVLSVTEYAKRYPQKLPDIGKYLEWRIEVDLRSGRLGLVQVTMRIAEELIQACSYDLSYFVQNVMNMIDYLLQSPSVDMLVVGTTTFLKFAEADVEEHSFYRRLSPQIHGNVSHFVQMSGFDATKDLQLQRRVRISGLHGLRAVFRMVNVLDASLQSHLDSVIPVLLANIRPHALDRTLRVMSSPDPVDAVLAGPSVSQEPDVEGPAEVAMDCLREIAGRVNGAASVQALLKPMFLYLDENVGWTDEDAFASLCMDAITTAIELRLNHLPLSYLLRHLDTLPAHAFRVKRSVIHLVEQQITSGRVAVGPSVLRMLDTLLHHLFNSFEVSAIHPTDISRPPGESSSQPSRTLSLDDIQATLTGDDERDDCIQFQKSVISCTINFAEKVQDDTQRMEAMEHVARWMPVEEPHSFLGAAVDILADSDNDVPEDAVDEQPKERDGSDSLAPTLRSASMVKRQQGSKNVIQYWLLQCLSSFANRRIELPGGRPIPSVVVKALTSAQEDPRCSAESRVRALNTLVSLLRLEASRNNQTSKRHVKSFYQTLYRHALLPTNGPDNYTCIRSSLTTMLDERGVSDLEHALPVVLTLQEVVGHASDFGVEPETVIEIQGIVRSYFTHLSRVLDSPELVSYVKSFKGWGARADQPDETSGECEKASDDPPIIEDDSVPKVSISIVRDPGEGDLEQIATAKPVQMDYTHVVELICSTGPVERAFPDPHAALVFDSSRSKLDRRSQEIAAGASAMRRRLQGLTHALSLPVRKDSIVGIRPSLAGSFIGRVATLTSATQEKKLKEESVASDSELRRSSTRRGDKGLIPRDAQSLRNIFGTRSKSSAAIPSTLLAYHRTFDAVVSDSVAKASELGAERARVLQLASSASASSPPPTSGPTTDLAVAPRRPLPLPNGGPASSSCLLKPLTLLPAAKHHVPSAHFVLKRQQSSNSDNLERTVRDLHQGHDALASVSFPQVDQRPQWSHTQRTARVPLDTLMDSEMV